MSTISKKICLVGDFGVGKTSLVRRFVDRSFSDQYLSTVGVKISRKLVDLEHVTQNAQLLIWDLEGHTKFKGIAPNYLQGSGGAVIVGDVTRPETIEHLSQHIQLFLSINAKSFVIIALNKIDLIDTDKLEKLEDLIQIDDPSRILATYKTSAKTGEEVDMIFQQLAYKMIEIT